MAPTVDDGEDSREDGSREAHLNAQDPARGLFILAMIPLFNYWLYPAISRVFPLTPIRKIGIGLFLTALSFVVIWLRVAYPRLREDQLQRLCWLVLVPLALGQLVLTAAVRVAL